MMIDMNKMGNAPCLLWLIDAVMEDHSPYLATHREFCILTLLAIW
jgi:hypothetical protein